MKKAGIILGILLVVLLVIKLKDRKQGERTFKEYLVNIDTASVDGFEIKPKNSEQYIKLFKENEEWFTTVEGKKVSADGSIPKEALKQLNKVKPKNVVATSKDQWANYEISDSLATHIKIKAGNKVLSDLKLGKFSFNQQRRSMTSYLRTNNEPTVYGVEGYLNMIFNRSPEVFRNSALVIGNTENWTKIAFNYPADSSFTLNKQGNQWMIDGFLADSTSISKYLGEVRYVSSQSFAAESEVNGVPSHSISITGKNMNPITIEAYPQENGEYILKSSQNQGNLFTDKQIMQKLFIGKSTLQ